MQFIHTWKSVLDGSKTQTSRIVKPGDICPMNGCDIDSIYNGGRLKWRVGNTYAVQPGRGKRAVARIRILEIHKRDVREFDMEDIKAEGFNGVPGFWEAWCMMHDKSSAKLMITSSHIRSKLYARPDERYTAWVLNFKRVQ